ncbi:hypothetical protein L7F22_055042 [Adiantum nelumboides]|nr:hypothetical protein [Adiantum nelumboides]
MTLYESMNADIFCQNIQVVADEVKQAAVHASMVIAVHVCLLEDLNTLHNDAQTTLGTLELEVTIRNQRAEAYSHLAEKTFKKEKREGKKAAGVAALCALDAALFSGVPVAAAVFAAGASMYAAASAYQFDKAKDQLDRYNVLSTAEEEEAKMAQKALEIVRDSLIDTIGNFVRAIEQVAGFLRKLEGDTSNYARNASKMAANKATIVIYLNVLKSHSSRIQQACADYLQIMPAVEGRLGALSAIGASDPNHVQNWLALNFPDHNPTTISYLLH